MPTFSNSELNNNFPQLWKTLVGRKGLRPRSTHYNGKKFYLLACHWAAVWTLSWTTYTDGMHVPIQLECHAELAKKRYKTRSTCMANHFWRFYNTAGAVLDYLGSTISNAISLQIFSAITGLIFCSLSLNFVPQFWLFCVVFGIGLFGLFVATAPLCKPFLSGLTSTVSNKHEYIYPWSCKPCWILQNSCHYDKGLYHGPRSYNICLFEDSTKCIFIFLSSSLTPFLKLDLVLL